MGYVNLELNFQKVIKEINAGAQMQRKAAAKLVYEAVKVKAKAIKKHSGNLLKGLYKKDLKTTSYVGFKAPAFHIWFLEFGTDKRFAKSRKGKLLSSPASRGEMPEMPILYPTFAENAGAVEDVLSQPWVK